jgi:hypothetical protein
MSKVMSTKKTHPVRHNKWSEAIKDAELKIAQLQRSIIIFKTNAKNGAPFPGELPTQN